MKYLVVAIGPGDDDGVRTFIIDVTEDGKDNVDDALVERAITHVMREHFREKWLIYKTYTKEDVAQWMLALTQE